MRCLSKLPVFVQAVSDRCLSRLSVQAVSVKCLCRLYVFEMSV